MDRQQMINLLVADSMDTLFDYEQDSETWAKDILLNGFKGFNDYTDDELREELEGRGMLDDEAA